DDLHAALVEFGLDLGHVAELCGADWREVLRVGKQHRPPVANPIVETDLALSGLRFEIRGCIIERKSHRIPPSLKVPVVAPALLRMSEVGAKTNRSRNCGQSISIAVCAGCAFCFAPTTAWSGLLRCPVRRGNRDSGNTVCGRASRA